MTLHAQAMEQRGFSATSSSPALPSHLFVIYLGSCSRVLLAKCGFLMQKEPIRNQRILLALCTKEAKFSFLAELPRRQEKPMSDAELHPWPGQGGGKDGSLLKRGGAQPQSRI